ncbi:hypothetical protein IFM89_019769 [Coptis chinensis]|uniref:Uncharacterized protein n=1 Tax=Coptis chinensis TaxID=261450 RepID=A0A835I3R6_9MAGN|nr:hypothetical protein IFM89_019769 [Coptis chinensis]
MKVPIEVRARNAKNAENAKKNIYRHTNGRGTYAHKLDKMEQVDASNKRRKEASVGGEGSVMEVDFDNDELSEVFGPDKGSRTRGISSNKSKKQLQRVVLPRHYCKKQALHPLELKGEMNEMKSSLSNVMGVLKDVLKAVKNNGTSTTQQPRA